MSRITLTEVEIREAVDAALTFTEDFLSYDMIKGGEFDAKACAERVMERIKEQQMRCCV